MSNKSLYQEELLWQEFCRYLGLAPNGDIDDVPEVDKLYSEFLHDKNAIADELFMKACRYRIAQEDLLS